MKRKPDDKNIRSDSGRLNHKEREQNKEDERQKERKKGEKKINDDATEIKQ